MGRTFLLSLPANDRFEIRANLLFVSHRVTYAKILRASQTEPQMLITSNGVPKDNLKYWHLHYITCLPAASLWVFLFIYLLTFIYLYLTTLRHLLSLFSKIIRPLWGGINITGICGGLFEYHSFELCLEKLKPHAGYSFSNWISN